MLELLHDTLQSLRAHALRFVLTSLGMVWGCFILAYATATMQGTSEHFEAEILEAGPRLVVAWSGSVLKPRVGERGARKIELDAEDVDRVRGLTRVDNAEPDLPMWGRIVRSGPRTKLVNILGTGPGAGAIRGLEAEVGRFLTPEDVAHGARVAVLGPVAAERLLPGRSPLGARIQIEGVAFRVVGVTVAKGEQMAAIGGWDDWKVFIPWTTAQRWILRDDEVAEFAFDPRTRDESPAAIEDVRGLLSLHHDFPPNSEGAIRFYSVRDSLKTLNQVMVGLNFFLVAAGLITLLVGAVGVMNIMLVVVGERVREIGLRKALGARRRDVFLQFLCEAGMVCGLSAVAGTLLGVAFTQLIGVLAPASAGLGSPPILSVRIVSVLTVAMVFAGVLAGGAPAWRASRVDPAVALRSN